jgi:hypothetical protein
MSDDCSADMLTVTRVARVRTRPVPLVAGVALISPLLPGLTHDDRVSIQTGEIR